MEKVQCGSSLHVSFISHLSPSLSCSCLWGCWHPIQSWLLIIYIEWEGGAIHRTDKFTNNVTSDPIAAYADERCPDGFSVRNNWGYSGSLIVRLTDGNIGKVGPRQIDGCGSFPDSYPVQVVAPAEFNLDVNGRFKTPVWIGVP